MSKKKISYMLICFLIVIIIIVFCFRIYISNIKNNLIVSGYFPLNETMNIVGFNSNKNNYFKNIISEKEIDIYFDFENDICTKNYYTFSLKGNVKEFNNEYYINKNLLEKILNVTLNYKNGKILFEENLYLAHSWLDISRIIAHAGGAVVNGNTVSAYSNSLESLILNYNLGQRIFEFDLYLTKDNQLAAVHDWVNYGYKDGTFLTAKEWKESLIYNKYTTMMISDLLDEMLVNKDMFLVTDTKSFDFTDEEIKLQFQLIYEEVKKRDIKLLDRIIPQIYNEKMYDIVKSVYDFKSIIYTTYAATTTTDKIIEFAESKEEIKVITSYYYGNKFNEQSIDKLHEKGLFIFMHTINTNKELVEGIIKNVDGFYSDLLLPSDYYKYYEVLKKNI